MEVGSNGGETRRQSLARLFWGATGLVGAGLIAPVFGYLIAPLFSRDQSRYIRIGRLEDFTLDQPKRVEVQAWDQEGWVTDRIIAIAWVVRRADGLVAFDPRCTHLGCAYHWVESAKEFQCPCHNARFAIDGCVVEGPPPRPLDTYRYVVRQGEVYIVLQPERNVGVGVWRCGPGRRQAPTGRV